MEVVFVQARVAVDRRAFAAHPAQDRVDRLRVAVQRAADHAVECECLLREVFAEPDALLLARRGQSVVVVRAEGRLPVPYQKKFSHRMPARSEGFSIGGEDAFLNFIF